MSSGVRINRLVVNAFRGISNPIDFDFSAPITLVYAPNGTGKTTLCEAAEWVLTGQVDRLRDKGHFDPKVLRSLFNPDKPNPVAAADIIVDGKQHRLKRRARASNQDAQLDGKEIGPTALLAKLAPSAAAEETNHIRAIALRQSWLRGTRFLTAEALAALVDSDEGTLERRTQVFADIFGIRHLLEAEKQLDVFIREMGSHDRRLAQDVEALESEINKLKQELQAEPPPGSETVDTLLLSAARHIGLPMANEKTGRGSVAERLQQVSAEIGRRQHQLDTQSAAIEAAAAEWGVRRETEARVQELEHVEATEAPILETQQSNEKLASAQLAEMSARREAIALRSRTIADGEAALARALSSLISAASDVPVAFGSPKTLNSLFLAVPEARMSEDGIEAMRAELRDIRETLDLASDRTARLGSLQAARQRIEPQFLPEEAIGALRQEVHELEVAATAAANRLDAVSGPLATLQSAGRELFAQHHDHAGSDCPLCGHDWPSSAALFKAVQQTLDSVPELERTAQQASSEASEAVRKAKQRLEEAVRLADEVRRIDAEINGINHQANALRGRLDRLNIPSADPFGTINAYFSRLAAASALSALTSEYDRVQFTLSDLPDGLLDDDMPLDDLAKHVAAHFRSEKLGADQQLTELAERHSQAGEARDELRNAIAVAQQSLMSNRDELAQLRPQLARLRRLWADAALGMEWTEASLAKVRSTVAEGQEQSKRAASQLAAAKMAWETELRRVRLDELERDVQPLRAKLAHVRARVGGAKEARDRFHDGYNEITQRQMADLIQAVNPLFARMHGNQVVDAILPGEKDEPLRWVASAADEHLDPSKDFSQGQRQDLALAFFLARARSLGGTFFLDEPVTHLDDLNRVGLLDIFRATVMESGSSMNLVITTASKMLARHMVEKFSSVGKVESQVGKTMPLRVIELEGNGRTGIEMRTAYPASA